MTKISGKFYPLQHSEWLRACKELSPTARDVLYYIRTIDPYSDGIEITAATIARDLGVHRSTVSRAFKDLEKKGFIDLELIRVKVHVLAKGLLCAESQPCCKGATSDAESQLIVQESNHRCEETTSDASAQQPTLETKTEKEFCSPNTPNTFHTNQTRGGEDLTKRYGDFKKRGEGFEGDCKIPEDLKNKLSELEIPLDNKVLKAIASHHLSQAYGAVAHIENTKETISNPRGVFLFQIARQPIESIGTRGRIYRASDFEGYSLDYLKLMYPNSWKQAAIHFGVDWSQELEEVVA